MGLNLHTLPLDAVIALVAGIVILVVPRVLNYAVAAYLVAIGVLGLLRAWQGHAVQPATVAALVAGILILIQPKLLNYVVAIYLIVVGLLGVLRY